MKKVNSSIDLVGYSVLNPEFTDVDTELMPVLAARVSHGQDSKTGVDKEKDEKLLQFLAKHRHTSPFEHLFVTFKVTCPIFVAREWHRHRTQSFNEISMRYTSDYIGEVFIPTGWRKQDDKNRQVGLEPLGESESSLANILLTKAYEEALNKYAELLAAGVCREQARMVIPVGHMTHFYASANLLNWAKFCNLRCQADAQKEIRDLAWGISDELEKLYPKPWKCLAEYYR